MSTEPQAVMVRRSDEAERRAREVEQQLTDDERFSLILSLMVVIQGKREPRVPPEVGRIAGWAPGVPRLGIPAQLITDGPLGVTNPMGSREGDVGTALACGMSLGASFNPALAREAGAAIGREARAHGFNVLCNGGINLVREPRHGRNFEYLSEDPLLSGLLGAANVQGVQSAGVVGMLKHVSLNCHETNKFWLDAIIDPAAHRESDLLAFQIGIEQGNPASLMGAYNKVNGAYNCGNEPILNGVIKGAMGFKGYVMSDWMAVYDWDFALKGLDQHSGAQLDRQEWFAGPLKQAYAEGRLPKERLSDMVRRILYAFYLVGADAWAGETGYTVDMAAQHAVALEGARQGIVLLENDGILPLAPGYSQIAVIGFMAHVGVVAGGGSSQVLPPGGLAARVPLGGDGLLMFVREQAFFAPSPLAEVKKLFPEAAVRFDPGVSPVAAAAIAARAELALVFLTKFESEGFDDPDFALPYGQDELVEAVAAANPNTVVVLLTGNPVAMPWRDKVRAIVEAWFPGQAGAQAIAELLAGVVEPSGRLPVSWVTDVSQLPRPELAGLGDPFGTPLRIEYHEGAEVGYRWLAKSGATPLYPFGYGLSYTSFSYDGLAVQGGETVTASFTVTNTGERPGADVPQLYLTDAAGEPRLRLLGFERVELQPGESRRITLTADPRLLARYDGAAGHWRIAAGSYRVALGRSAADWVATAEATLGGRTFGS